MKESQLYLRFFRTNLPLILLPGLLAGSLAAIYQHQTPATQHLRVLLEMNYNNDNVQNQTQLTDQAVSLLRELNIQKQLGIGKSKVEVYKPGPLLVTIDLSAAEQGQLKSDLDKLQTFAQTKFPLEQVGEIVQAEQKVAAWIWGVGGLVLGSLLGLIVALIKAYLQAY